MPRENNPDLHGNVPENAETVLIIIDVFNGLEFTEGKRLLRAALPAARRLAKLKIKLRRKNVPTIYVNDNFGRWKSDQSSIVKHYSNPAKIGSPLANILSPEVDDYFIIKTKNSGFYGTPLALLLQYLSTKNVILTGISTENCVFLTAAGAFMRDLDIYIPEDCVASASSVEKKRALLQMQKLLRARVVSSSNLLRKLPI